MVKLKGWVTLATEAGDGSGVLCRLESGVKSEESSDLVLIGTTEAES